MRITEYECVIFDLDGVLLDTEKLYTDATQRVVGAFGKTFEWSLKAKMMGRHEREGAELLVEALALPISADEYLRRQLPIAEELFLSSTEISGAESFVHELGRRGHRLAVATSSVQRLYRMKTAHLPWFAAFEVVITGDHPEVRALKPAPDIFLAAARALEASPARCLVIEDSPAGVLAARAAGMGVVAIPDAALEDARFATAHAIVRSYAELRQILGC